MYAYDPVTYPIKGVSAYVPYYVLYDPDLKPQNTENIEGGFDLRMFNDRVRLEYTVSYQNVTESGVYDMSFLKLRDVTLTYKLPKIGKFDIDVFGFARNVLIWAKLPNFDPEASQGNNQLMKAELRMRSETAASSTYNNEWNATYGNLMNIKQIIEKCEKRSRYTAPAEQERIVLHHRRSKGSTRTGRFSRTRRSRNRII